MGAGEPFRAVASLVYDAAGQPSYESVRREAFASCWRDDGVDERGREIHGFTFDRNAEVFTAVGGPSPWRALLGRLGETGPFGTLV